MPIITFADKLSYDNDRIMLLWNMIRMARELEDTPQVWKLTDPFLDAVGQFLKVSNRDLLLCQLFLDTSLDQTSRDPRLICVQATYPLNLLEHKD